LQAPLLEYILYTRLSKTFNFNKELSSLVYIIIIFTVKSQVLMACLTERVNQQNMTGNDDITLFISPSVFPCGMSVFLWLVGIGKGRKAMWKSLFAVSLILKLNCADLFRIYSKARRTLPYSSKQISRIFMNLWVIIVPAMPARFSFLHKVHLHLSILFVTRLSPIPICITTVVNRVDIPRACQLGR